MNAHARAGGPFPPRGPPPACTSILLPDLRRLSLANSEPTWHVTATGAKSPFIKSAMLQDLPSVRHTSHSPEAVKSGHVPSTNTPGYGRVPATPRTRAGWDWPRPGHQAAERGAQDTDTRTHTLLLSAAPAFQGTPTSPELAGPPRPTLSGAHRLSVSPRGMRGAGATRSLSTPGLRGHVSDGSRSMCGPPQTGWDSVSRYRKTPQRTRRPTRVKGASPTATPQSTLVVTASAT